MSDFFEPPPRPDPPERQAYRTPPWVGAPRGTLPGVVPFERVLARTDQVAVYLTALAVFPTGFEFEIVSVTAAERGEHLDPLLFAGARHAGREIPPEQLRLGVQFSDGSKATNTGGFPLSPGRPTAPVLVPGGGGGGSGHSQQTLWVWPLPPLGPVAFVCEWPAMQIPLTRTEIDAQAILDAAARAQVIFSDHHLPEPPSDETGGWRGYASGW